MLHTVPLSCRTRQVLSNGHHLSDAFLSVPSLQQCSSPGLRSSQSPLCLQQAGTAGTCVGSRGHLPTLGWLVTGARMPHLQQSQRLVVWLIDCSDPHLRARAWLGPAGVRSWARLKKRWQKTFGTASERGGKTCRQQRCCSADGDNGDNGAWRS